MNFWLDLKHGSTIEKLLHVPRLQRAIGVIYRPQTGRESYYFFTQLPYQFNIIIHLDETHALKPLTVNDEKAELEELSEAYL